MPWRTGVLPGQGRPGVADGRLAGSYTAAVAPRSWPYTVPGVSLDREDGTANIGARAGVAGLGVLAGTRVTVYQDDARHVSFFVTVGRKF